MASGSLLEPLFLGVAKAVVPWLEYQDLSGRSTLLGESYLAQPIGEQLRLGHAKVVAEYNHPVIVSARRGRQRQVDYVLLGAVNNSLIAGLEVKWVDAASLAKQRLVDDLLRLECLRASPTAVQSVSRYFLIAGRRTHVETTFLGSACNTGGGARSPFASALLATPTNRHHEVDVRGVPSYLRVYFKSFEQSYNVPVPTWLRTSLIADQGTGEFRALMWKIDCGTGRRSTFSAATTWQTEQVPDVEDDGA
jgi:hypothetical protein